MLRNVAVAAVSGGLLLLAGCGIEAFILLSPPTVIDYAGNAQFKFRATADNSEGSFLGFELYYKIYRLGSIGIPVSFNSYEEMIAAGFYRINRATDSPGSVDKPLLDPAPADIGTAYIVTLDFSNAVTTIDYPRLTSDTAPPTYNQVRRSVSTAGGYKKFLVSDFIPTDFDINSDIYSDLQTPLQVLVVCYAISYGIDLTSGLEVYSQPVWLGNGDIQFLN